MTTESTEEAREPDSTEEPQSLQSTPETRERLQAEARGRLSRYLEATRGDLEWIVQQLDELGWTPPKWFVEFGPGLLQRAVPSVKAGRPKAIATLEKELRLLEGAAAHLHAQLIELRGEAVFQVGSGLDRLAELGIVKAPAAPTKAPANRPRGRPTDRALVFFYDLAMAYGRREGRAWKQRQALDLACEAMRYRKLTQRESFESSDLRKARRRIRAAEKSPPD